MAASAAPRAIGPPSTPSSRRLRKLEADETLLVQSGKPVGIFRTHADAPRVLIANSNLVPHWANWAHFNELDRKGLMMYGQMTAGSWIYIGSQGIVQGTYETFVEAGRKHFGGDLAGKWILTAGLGGMGGAQALAGTMAGASILLVECRRSRIEKRLETKYLDTWTASLDEALALIKKSCAEKKPLSVGLLGNAADIYPELVQSRREARSRHRSNLRARSGQRLLPEGLDASPNGKRASNPIPRRVDRAARASIKEHVEAMLAFAKMGVPTFDYGNNIRQVAKEEGVANAFDFPGFVPAYIRPLFCRGVGPFRWAALSGDPEDIAKTDAKVRELMPRRPPSAHWLDMAAKRIKFQGLPARICWVGLGDRHRLGLAFNDMVATRRTQSADRHRPRSSGLRLGRQPQPRDRSDEGRLRRRLRLAAAERAAQLRQRRDLGLAPSRRRRRHGLLAARRHGHRLRRHARTPRAASSACSGTTRRPASCATPTPATTKPSPAPANTTSTCRC